MPALYHQLKFFLGSLNQSNSKPLRVLDHCNIYYFFGTILSAN